MTKTNFPERHLSTEYMQTHTTHTLMMRERKRGRAHLGSLLCKSIESIWQMYCKGEKKKHNAFSSPPAFILNHRSYHHSQPGANTWLIAATCQLRKSWRHAWLHMNGQGVKWMATQSRGLGVSTSEYKEALKHRLRWFICFLTSQENAEIYTRGDGWFITNKWTGFCVNIKLNKSKNMFLNMYI